MAIKLLHSKINKIFKLHALGIESTTIGKNISIHPSTVRRYLSRKGLISTGNLSFKINENFLNKICNLSAWFLGMMASDGSIRRNLKHFCISQSGANGLKTIEYIKLLLNFEGNILHHKNAHSLHITSKKLVKNMYKYNIVPNKTLLYNFPKSLSKKFQKAFIRGYFDGDGSLGAYRNKGRKYLHLCASLVGTKEFILEIKKIIPIESILRKIDRCKNLYELRWNGKNAVEFCKWLFSDEKIYKSYKYFIFKNYLKNREDKFTKYEHKKIKAKKLFVQGNNCIKIAKILNIRHQTIYRWKNYAFL